MKIKQLLLGILLMGAVFTSKAQLLLDENFDYGITTGDSLTNPAIGGANWKRHSGTGGPLSYIPTSLTYTGYASSGVGGAMTFAHAAGSREDANQALSTAASSGNVFVSFLLNVTASGGATGDYAFHLNDTNGNILPNNIFKARVFIKDGATTGTFKLGISKSGAIATAGFTTADYNLNETYLVVVKYIFNSGTATDDSVYVNVISGAIPSSEPTFVVTPTDNATADLTRVKSVCIRQGTTGTASAIIDGIRVATTWADLMPTASGSTPPSPATALVASALTGTTATLSWTKPAAYVDSSMTTLVFLKQGSAPVTGTPTLDPASYLGNTDFSAATSQYQNDAGAKCLYNNDSSSISVSGLAFGTIYHALIYVVHTGDSMYSSGATTTIQTLSALSPVTALSFTAGGPTQATINWNKASGYVDSTMTTLVFVKKGAVISGAPSGGVGNYTASSTMGSGTKLASDTNAYCVFVADSNSVTISNLTASSSYYVSVYVVRDADSAYSNATNGNGTTPFGVAPYYTIGSINNVNSTTGVADSNGVKVLLRGVVYGSNQRATGLQFVLRDPTGGTTIFITNKNFGYTVTEGDSIEVQGVVTTFRGLHEIGALDTLALLGTGKTLKQATVVPKVDEAAENDLVRVNDVKFITVPAGGVWPSSSTNISVTNANNDTIVVRILSTFAIAGKPLPTTPTFNIVGLGVQFSTSSAAPYAFNGYQLFPRTQADVTENVVVPPPVDSLNAFNLISPANNDTIVLTSTNLGDTVILSWSPSMNSNGIDTTNYTFILDTVGQDFSNPRFEMPTGISTILPLTKSDIYGLAIANGIGSGQLFAGIWQVKAESKNLVRYSGSFRNVFILNNIFTGVTELNRLNAIGLYPNPAKEEAIINGLIPHKDVVSVIGITGKMEMTFMATEGSTVLPLSALSAGLYFVKIQSGDAVVIKKLLVQ